MKKIWAEYKDKFSSLDFKIDPKTSNRAVNVQESWFYQTVKTLEKISVVCDKDSLFRMKKKRVP
jgi:hypothetical protein